MSRTIGLVGFGRFGKMAYDHLRGQGEIRVWTRSTEKLAGLPEAASFEDVARCDVVVLTVAISAMEETCRRLAPLLRQDQIVVDACSVKVWPVAVMKRALPESVSILATHPLFGPDSGGSGIRGLKIVLCPVRIADEPYRHVFHFLQSLGLIVIEATPEEHDRQAARSQAVFHFLARAFQALGWGGEPMATPGPEAFFRQIDAVQNDTAQLFQDLQRLNPYSAECRRQLIQALTDIDQDLD
jgi:prephenate dehydrogenase